MILSGYSSLILEMRSVPIPDPVPPPREWVSWNPCKWKIRENRELVIAQGAFISSAGSWVINKIISRLGEKSDALRFQ